MPFSHDPDTLPLSSLILIGDLLLLYQAKNQTSFAIQTDFEESANQPSPQKNHNISIPENECSRSPAHPLYPMIQPNFYIEELIQNTTSRARMDSSKLTMF